MANDRDQSNPLPPLSADEREALKASIATEGVVYPIVQSAGPYQPGALVDGFHRRELWLELGRPDAELPRISRPFESEAEFRIAQIDLNAKRRQLTVAQRVMLAMAREPWEKKLAEQRRRELSGKKGLEKVRQGSEWQRATALAAEAAGLKRDTYEHGRLVLEKGPEAIRAQFLAGTISVHRAYSETKRELGMGASATMTKHVGQRIGRLPAGSYGAILVTPPWRTTPKTFERGHVLPAELSALAVRGCAGKDAVVAIVAPARWLRESFEVLAAWGASVATVLARVRGRSAEFVVVGTFGKPIAELPRENVIETEAQLYALLDGLVPDREGIVLFGETSRAGWSSWSPTIK